MAVSYFSSYLFPLGDLGVVINSDSRATLVLLLIHTKQADTDPNNRSVLARGRREVDIHGYGGSMHRGHIFQDADARVGARVELPGEPAVRER